MKNVLLLLVATSFFITACSAADSPQPTTSPLPTASPVASGEPISVIQDDVVLIAPDQNTAVSSPLTIEGLAPGTWFFEANIVGELQTEAGETLVTFPLQAQGEWMTEEHVRFEGEVEFEAPTGAETVQLIIRNDNPSGLPENEKSQAFTLLLEK